jgi:putative transposase
MRRIGHLSDTAFVDDTRNVRGMPRPPRFPQTGFPLHVVQRGNDRRRCFFEDGDFRFYLRSLGEAARRYQVLVHAYVLMTNHVHLLLTPLVVGAVSRAMQSVTSRYVKRVNARTGRVGTLWESRYRACLVDEDPYVLAVCRYNDLNPLSARNVASPEEYPWSSYGALAGLRSDPLVARHCALELLGQPSSARYASWCAEGIATEELEHLRESTTRGVRLGSDEAPREVPSLRDAVPPLTLL